MSSYSDKTLNGTLVPEPAAQSRKLTSSFAGNWFEDRCPTLRGVVADYGDVRCCACLRDPFALSPRTRAHISSVSTLQRARRRFPSQERTTVPAFPGDGPGCSSSATTARAAGLGALSGARVAPVSPDCRNVPCVYQADCGARHWVRSASQGCADVRQDCIRGCFRAPPRPTFDADPLAVREPETQAMTTTQATFGPGAKPSELQKKRVRGASGGGGGEPDPGRVPGQGRPHRSCRWPGCAC